MKTGIYNEKLHKEPLTPELVERRNTDNDLDTIIADAEKNARTVLKNHGIDLVAIATGKSRGGTVRPASHHVVDGKVITAIAYHADPEKIGIDLVRVAGSKYAPIVQEAAGVLHEVFRLRQAITILSCELGQRANYKELARNPNAEPDHDPAEFREYVKHHLSSALKLGMLYDRLHVRPFEPMVITAKKARRGQRKGAKAAGAAAKEQGKRTAELCRKKLAEVQRLNKDMGITKARRLAARELRSQEHKISYSTMLKHTKHTS